MKVRPLPLLGSLAYIALDNPEDENIVIFIRPVNNLIIILKHLISKNVV